MHFALLFPVFLVLVCLPETSTFMDCRPACQMCRKGSPTSDNLELYCSMCKECRDRNHDVKARSLKEEQKERPEGTSLSSTEPSYQFTKRLGSPGGLLAAAGGRPRLSIGMRGRLLGPRGRLLRPRLDFMKKHPLGEGGRLGKTGNGAIRFLRGQDDTLDVAAHRAQILSKYAFQPVNVAQLSSPRQYVILTQTTIPTTLITTVIKSKEKLIVKMEQIEKDLHKQRNKHQILNELRNELQSNEDQLMKPNEMRRFQKDYVVKSLSEHFVNVPTFVPLEELRPLVIGDQIVYLHEATTARPAGCPPPPPDCEEVTEKVLLLAVTTTSTTTTTTTTEPQTRPPCPPIKCQKKQLCCPDCPCPEPQPPLLMLPPPPPLLPPPPPMLPPPAPMLPPPPVLLPPAPLMLQPQLHMQRPPPPPMLPQPPTMMMQPPSLMLPPPPPMIPRPPLPMLPPQPPPMVSRPLQPMLPLSPLLPPPPPLPPMPPIMAIPMVPQLMMRPPISMLNPQCMGNGCNHPHSIKPNGHAGQRWLSEQNGQYDKKGQGFPNIQADYDIPLDNNIYEEYTGKIRFTEYLRKKTTVTQHFNKDYYYLYVGVPKNNVKHLKNKLLREGVRSNTIPTE